MQDRDTQRVYRLYDFTKAQLIPPDKAYCIAGKVNSADRLYLVTGELAAISKSFQGREELQFAGIERVLDIFQKQAAEQARQYAHRQEETGPKDSSWAVLVALNVLVADTGEKRYRRANGRIGAATGFELTAPVSPPGACDNRVRHGLLR
jgi:hypothetical protein